MAASFPVKTSPYKKMKTGNSTYVQYVSCKELRPHRLYKIYKIHQTKHEKYGDGYMAFLKDSNNKHYKVQIPGKYLAMLDLPEDMNIMTKDIEKKDNPYFIFREELPNKSFLVDIIPGDPTVLEAFDKNEDFPELNDSENSDC